MPFGAPGSWLLSFVEIANAPHPSPLPPGEREFLVAGFAVGRHPIIFLKKSGGKMVLDNRTFLGLNTVKDNTLIATLI